MVCFKKFSKAQKNIALGAIVFSFLVHSFTSTCDFLTANSTSLALGVLVGKVFPLEATITGNRLSAFGIKIKWAFWRGMQGK